MLTNYNGHMIPAEQAQVPAGNTAFRYGHGLFETMLVRDSAIRLAAYHWQRLLAGLQQLHFVLPAHFSPTLLEGEVLRTVRKNGLERLCRVRLQVFGSNGGIFGPEDDMLHYLVECYPLNDSDLLLNENGLVTGIATGVAKSADSMSNLKSCNALVYSMAARQAGREKWNDALVCNTHGRIAESTIANIFWVKDGSIYTPPLAEGCVAGVMRRHILATVPGITETPLPIETLQQADEVFLTNAIKGIRWVRTTGDTKYGNSIIQQLYKDLFQDR
ncbi:aminodeoxychorismate lyase [Nemorincola caseinilytica]|uniref:branched-chain-amino-acid transaminase n=1 Tax=Nemorincola caseinilytica TaxID=2054315 RepID=A0ABP8NBB1_9BACT